MIVDIHLVFYNVLIGPLIHVVGEGDGVLLRTSHHRDEEAMGVEVAHVRDRRIPLIQKVTFFDEQPCNFLFMCQHIRRRTTILQQLDI